MREFIIALQFLVRDIKFTSLKYCKKMKNNFIQEEHSIDKT